MDLSELGVKPISEGQPAGEDVRYEQEFEDLQAEIDKLSSASTGGEGIQWDMVVKLSIGILSEKSKNFQVATYMAVALLHTDQFEGLVQGTVVLQGLLENFWDTMFPPKKRMRGRLNAVEWWVEQTQAYLDDYQPDPLDPDLVERARQALDALDRTLSEKSDEAPVLQRLLNYVARLPVAAEEAVVAEPETEPATEPSPPEPAPESAEADTPGEPVTAPQAPEPAAQPAPPQASPAPRAAPPPPQVSVEIPDGVASAKEAVKAVQAGLKQMTQLSYFILQQDLADPLPYRLIRVAAWLPLDSLPLTKGDHTLLPPPESTIWGSLEKLAAGHNDEGIILAAENRVFEYRFWLDLTRVTAEALGRLGGKYAAARNALESETAMFVQRLPGLEPLCFSDGTPFADKETKAWLKSIGRRGAEPAPVASGDAGGAGDAGEEVGEVYGKALSLAGDRKLAEAVNLIELRLNQSRSGKEKLVWRTALARLLFDMGRGGPAMPHAEEIIRQADLFRLDEWDPELAVNSLMTAYRIIVEGDDEKMRQQAGNILDRIARLSPGAALSLAGVEGA